MSTALFIGPLCKSDSLLPALTLSRLLNSQKGKLQFYGQTPLVSLWFNNLLNHCFGGQDWHNFLSSTIFFELIPKKKRVELISLLCVYSFWIPLKTFGNNVSCANCGKKDTFWVFETFSIPISNGVITISLTKCHENKICYWYLFWDLLENIWQQRFLRKLW